MSIRLVTAFKHLSFVGLFILLTNSPSDCFAEWKWKAITADEAVLKLKNWPTSNDQCRFVLGKPGNYSRENTIIKCPQWTGDDEPRTYFRVIELLEGFRWGGTYGKPVPEAAIFNRPKGWLKYFNNPQFKSGQKLECYNDSECYFQRLEFSVKGRECQYVGYVPDLKYSSRERSEAPYSLQIVTCETTVPITEKHIKFETDKITLTFPGGKASADLVNINRETASPNSSLGRKPLVELCVGALSPDSRGWTEWNTPWKNEVLRRGLGIADCQQAIGFVPTPMKANLPKEGERSPNDNSSPSATTSFGRNFAPKSLPPKTSNKVEEVSEKPISNIQKRLEVLKQLEKNGLISSEEARKKREAILGEL